jgi:hypothetical protein
MFLEGIDGDKHFQSSLLINPKFNKSPGKFFQVTDSTKFTKEFWVLDVGTVQNSSINQQCTWMIITTPLRIELLVLVRDLDEFKSEYELTVLQKLKDNKFTEEFNHPRGSIQSKSECKYTLLK